MHAELAVAVGDEIDHAGHGDHAAAGAGEPARGASCPAATARLRVDAPPGRGSRGQRGSRAALPRMTEGCSSHEHLGRAPAQHRRADADGIEHPRQPARLRGGGRDLLARAWMLVMVPMLTTSAEAIATISATSSGACAMMGDAPTASRPFAVVFMTTALVMLWTRGRARRMAARTAAGVWSPACPSVVGLVIAVSGGPAARGPAETDAMVARTPLPPPA